MRERIMWQYLLVIKVGVIGDVRKVNAETNRTERRTHCVTVDEKLLISS